MKLKMSSKVTTKRAHELSITRGLIGLTFDPLPGELELPLDDVVATGGSGVQSIISTSALPSPYKFPGVLGASSSMESESDCIDERDLLAFGVA